MSVAGEGGSLWAVGAWLLADPLATSSAPRVVPDGLAATLLVAMLALTSATVWLLQRERRRASLLEARLSLAERRANATLLAPHFLLNTLNAVTGLVRHDAHEAERMLCTMGDLLRCALRQEGTHAVPLRDELDLAREYLALMSLRWREQLCVDVDVPGDALDALVPALVMQPLLENALRHGLSPVRPPRLEIRARRDRGMLMLQVCDDGPGLPTDEAATIRDGIGLSATRARLAAIFGDAHRVELRNRSPRGVVASVVIPYRPVRAVAASPEAVREEDADPNDHRRRRADCA